MTTYLDKALASKISPPQSEPLDSDQVANSAGGFSWKVDDFTRLRRFLILGSEGGSYYANERKLSLENVDAVERCIKIDGPRTVSEIARVSVEGRAPKNDQAILALALCIAKGDELTKKLALLDVNNVCRIGTHLFQLVEFLNKLGTLTGRAKRRALAEWYTEKSVDQAAYQAVKYRNRAGWTHRDVIRVAHPGSLEAVSPEHATLFEWIAGKSSMPFTVDPVNGRMPLPDVVIGFELAQLAETPAKTADLVRSMKLPREALKTEHLTSPEVWEALLETGMGLTALIRNLGNMTRIGVLTPDSDATQEVIRRLKSAEDIKKARVHPMNVLFALKTYQSGHGFRGTNTWNPVAKIVNALDGAFYKAFGNVEPTNQSIMLALDVSGSMTYPLGDTGLTCRDGSAAMAMVTEAVEDRVETVAFTSGGGRSAHFGYGSAVTPLDISSRQRLDDVVRKVSGLPFGGTDCALPMIYAQKKGKKVDTFIVYTDSETWHGNVHPAKALKDYRKASGINARLIVVGMVSNGFSIADPKDPGMLDVVGFDTATPQIITDFSLGRI